VRVSFAFEAAMVTDRISLMLMQPMRTAITFAALAAASLAPAQSVAPLEVNLQPIDQRVGDVGLLSSSLRIIQPGLAVQTSFDQVYQAPGSVNQLMRVQGALRAVYLRSQSAYVQTPWGVTPEIPAGTVFHIGQTSLDKGAQPTAALPGDVLRWNTRVTDSRINTRTGSLAPDDSNAGIPNDRSLTPAERAALEERLQRLRELFREYQNESADAQG